MTFPNTSISRRKFAALSGAAVALAGQTFTSTVQGATGTAPKKKYPIGLELYSVRGELQKDLPGTLRKVAEIGYDSVEFYAPYYAWKYPYAKEVKSIMDDLGLRCYSTHNHVESFTAGKLMAHAIELNQILGSKYIVMSSAPGKDRSRDFWMKLCEQFSAASETFTTHGFRAGFHNHQTEWAKLPGSDMSAMEILSANTPKDFCLQFDVGTCMEAGKDPIAWVKANPGRINSVHLKDWAPGTKEDEKSYRVIFGEGPTPWKQLMAELEKTGGVEYYIMEQEGSRFSEFETAERCLATWKKMRGKYA
jgi:sugar phosphate isomerase/epimerase